MQKDGGKFFLPVYVEFLARYEKAAELARAWPPGLSREAGICGKMGNFVHTGSSLILKMLRRQRETTAAGKRCLPARLLLAAQADNRAE